MTWGKLDDGMAFHPKIVAAGNAAVGAWARMISWCSQPLTDGRVPAARALVISNGGPAVIETLVAARLLDETEGGYAVHDYLDYNPSREQVLAERAKWKKRQVSARDTQRDTTRDTTSDAPRDTSSPVPVPVPVPGSRSQDNHTSSPAANRPGDPADFEARFYRHYPRRQAGAAGAKAWAKLSEADRLAAIDDVVARSRATRDPQWVQGTDREGRSVIPLPASYLNGRRWTDEEPVKPHDPEDDVCQTCGYLICRCKKGTP